MTTFALVHGSGDGGWHWQLVRRALEARGHVAVAPDLPTDRDDATWDDCVDVVARAVGDAGDVGDVVVVGHSAGGFVAPLVADRVDAQLQVYVAGMVPAPGETAMEWFGSCGWDVEVSDDPMVSFYADVPEVLARAALAHEKHPAERLGGTPWPLRALPSTPARYVVTTHDRFLGVTAQRNAAARLGITHPDAIETGHCPHLARPEELAELLASYPTTG
jgi:pimeloyl-ACP methyl ester carboxylesterase